MRRTHRTALPIITASLTLALAPVVHLQAQTLQDVLVSDELQAIERANARTYQHVPTKETDPNSNFSSLWKTNKSPLILLSWLELKFINYRIKETTAGVFPEYAGAKATLKDKQGSLIQLYVQVPKPAYTTMAKYNTLASFNRFMPPTLEVTHEETVQLHSLTGTLYHAKNGECSLLIKFERMSIANLRSKTCAAAPSMIDIAKRLNFARLAQKLNS